MDKRKEFEQMRVRLLNELPNECSNCGSVDHLDIHHIIPLSLEGTNRKSNLVVLCVQCHGKIHGIDRTNHKNLQKEGIERARRNGRYLGRPKKELTNEIKVSLDFWHTRWKSNKIKAVDLMRILKLKKTTFYKIVKEYEALSEIGNRSTEAKAI